MNFWFRVYDLKLLSFLKNNIKSTKKSTHFQIFLFIEK